MNAKSLILLCLCAISFTGICDPTDPPTGADKIHLSGLLDVGTGPDVVEAYADQNFVYIYFHQNLGNVSISLYNEMGIMVYSNVVNTAVQQTVIIPITGANSGRYTLVLENATGYAEGAFNKTP